MVIQIDYQTPFFYLWRHYFFVPEIVIPMITPFRGEELDSKVLTGFIEYARENHFDGLFPGGSTGGFASLSQKKHGDFLREVIEESTGLKLFAGICRNNVEETIEMGKIAIDLGYTNLVSINPYYHKYSEASVENFFDRVISALDSDIYIYNNPSLSGYRLKPDLVERLKEKHPQVVGMKDSGNDMAEFGKFLNIKGLKVYQGKDAHIHESIERGAVGGVCSTANFALNTLLLAKNQTDIESTKAKTKRLVELVSHYDVPAIHNYLFRKFILNEIEPRNYVNPPFVDLKEVPELLALRENTILTVDTR